ncbi:hypothetical protein J7K93_12100 [bacterium]|nr:hypothetical protein [bacterium]
MENDTFYLDEDILCNPARSKAVKTVTYVLFFIIIINYIFITLNSTFTQRNYSNVLFSIYGLVLFGMTVKKIVIYYKYGRKHIKIGEENIEIKSSYSKNPLLIQGSQIRDISFSSRQFKINLNNEESILFKASLDKYLDLRKNLQSFAQKYNIMIIG